VALVGDEFETVFVKTTVEVSISTEEAEVRDKEEVVIINEFEFGSRQLYTAEPHSYTSVTHVSLQQSPPSQPQTSVL
jgi:hypothetical protein